MKKIYFICMICLLFTAALFSETIDILFVTTTGNVIRKVDSDISKITISASDQFPYDITNIKNLDALKKLEQIDIYNVTTIKDYSFLTKCKNIKYLGFANCKVYDLHFLERMSNLEVIDMDLLPLDKKDIEKIHSEPIDLSGLKYLKFLRFSASNLERVPLFIHVNTKPYLAIDNNNISSFTDEDIQLLKQYSLINIDANPVMNIKEEYEKLANLPILREGERLPEEIKKYY